MNPMTRRLNLDRDLRLMRRVALVFAMFNFVMTIVYVYQREWLYAASSLSWVGCCRLWLRMISTIQRERDERKRDMETLIEGMSLWPESKGRT